MSQAINAIYKGGHFVPLAPVQGVQDNQSVRLTILVSKKEEHPLMRFVGSISNEEANELSEVIQEEFEKVNSDEWF